MMGDDTEYINIGRMRVLRFGDVNVLVKCTGSSLRNHSMVFSKSPEMIPGCKPNRLVYILHRRVTLTCYRLCGPGFT